MTPEKIRAQIAGGILNGSVFCSASQMGALSAAGVKINGNMETYPDGWQLREGNKPLCATEAAALAAGSRVYLAKQVLLEQGVPQALAAADVRLQGRKGVLCFAADAQALGRIYEGDLSRCAFVPDGYTVHDGDLDVGARTAFKLRGRIYLTGKLTIREDVGTDQIGKLERLRASGRVVAPLSLIDALMEKTDGDADWIPYEGALLVNGEKMDLTPEGLESLPERIAIVNDGMLSIEPTIPAQALQGRVTLLLNDGICRLAASQRGALVRALCGNGAYQDAGQAEKEKRPDEDDLRNDVRIIKDVASLTL